MAVEKQLHNLCEDKEYMAKMDALPLEPWGGQELALEEFESSNSKEEFEVIPWKSNATAHIMND